MNYTLTSQGRYKELPYKPAADRGGLLLRPELLLIHYTAGASTESDTEALTKLDDRYVSAHFLIGRDGAVSQLVPTNLKAYHAGESEYKGRKFCNAFSIGIELSNWGPLEKRGDKFYAWPGEFRKRVVPAADVVEARHENPACAYQYWERFPEVQVASLKELCLALCRDIPSLKAVTGHDVVAPKRKIDPGPAFPMAELAAALQPAFAGR